ncbi:putative membrane protein [Brucella rhizosphaerae]|uniref:Putative membrane protein n=1 Tax=Brucella rhizosphaerae TaxID=571254 RepID=A0A256FM16_9HYPH|nr:putative membrane protein [Brucella rhizosphaerae]
MTVGIPVGLALFLMFCFGALVGLFIGTVATLFSLRAKEASHGE